MAPKESKRRRRSYLKPEALEQLKLELDRRCCEVVPLGRLTWEIRAEVLAVSVPTARALLANSGVDRSTLQLAYSRLGMAWRDDLCAHDLGVRAPQGGQIPRPRSAGSGRVLMGATSLVLLPLLLWGLKAESKSMENMLLDDRRSSDFNRELKRGTELYHSGKYVESRRHIAAAIRLARMLNSTNKLSFALRMSGDLSAVKGRFDLARRDYLEALHIRELTNEPEFFPAIQEALGDLETRAGSFRAAKAYLSASLNGYRKIGDRGGIAMVCRDLGSLAYLKGDLASADSWFWQSGEIAQENSASDLLTDIRARQSLVLARRGQHEAALRTLYACLAYWINKQHRRWIAVTQLQIGTVEIAFGLLERGRTALNSSKMGFEAVGDQAGVAACERQLEPLRAHR